MHTKRQSIKNYLLQTFVPIFVHAPLVGIISGTIVFAFKYCVHFAEKLSSKIYDILRISPHYIPLWVLAIFVLGGLISFVLKICPDIKGGGIPRVAGMLRGLLIFKWLRTLIGTFASSLIGFFSGLPLGTEGPSVVIGASTGKGYNKLTKSTPVFSRYLMTGGAGAGFAVATGAPLSGIIFILEEIHKRFSFFILIIAISSVAVACLTAELLCHLTGMSLQFLTFKSIVIPSLSKIWIAPLIGIAAGLVAVLFNVGMALTDKLSSKYDKIPRFVKITLALLIAAVAGFFVKEVHGTGQTLINDIIQGKILISVLLLVVILKIITVTISANSGATGGLFVPVLAIGALFGGILGSMFLKGEYLSFVICITICAFLGGVMSAPITAIVFIMEITGRFDGVLFYVTAIIFSLAVTSIFNIDSINDTLLNKLLRQNDIGRKKVMIVLEAEVKAESFAANKRAKDILWPADCIVRSMTRSAPQSPVTMVRGGEKVFLIGDKLLIQAQTCDESTTMMQLAELLGQQEFVKAK